MKIKAIFIFLVILVGAIGIIYILNEFIYNFFTKQDNMFNQASYSGVVKEIKFDMKKIPTVKILDSNYYLDGYSGGLFKIIKVNDSLVKKIYSMDYILYRKDSLGIWRLIYGIP